MPMNLDFDRLESIKALAEVAGEAYTEPWAYADLTRTAAEVCRAPIALVSLAEGDTLRVHTQVGLEEATPLADSFCAHAMEVRDQVLVVEDASGDARFAHQTQVAGPHAIRFCAGARLETSRGELLGSLCALAPTPRRLDAVQLRTFQFLARQMSRMLEQQGARGA